MKAVTSVSEGRGYVSATVAEGLAADLQRTGTPATIVFPVGNSSWCA